MEVLWLVIVIVAWVVSTVNKSKKQQAQQARRPAAPRPANAAPARSAAPAPVQRASVPQEKKQAPKPAVHQPEPLVAHMHTPVMGVEGIGTEGVDCCHEYMLDQPAPEQPSLLGEETPEMDTEMARAMLQGVVMSEILGRRPQRRYGGRRA